MISNILFCLIFCAQGLNMYENSNLLALKLEGKHAMFLYLQSIYILYLKIYFVSTKNAVTKVGPFYYYFALWQ